MDVKDENGQPTKAQVEKWTELHKLGIPVYVVRTSEDVDALVAGTLASWAPTARVKARLYPTPLQAHESYPCRGACRIDA